MDISLRPATEADAPRLREIVRDAYGIYVERIGREPRPMTEDYAEVVRASDVYAAESDGEIVGLVVLIPGDDEGFLLDNVAVDPSLQGHRRRQVLLEHAEAKAREAGFDSIYLFTHETMTENLALYERIGYVEYDRRRQDGGDHVVYLRKQLG